MIYSSVVYEQQFNTLINADVISEFYQNEINILNAIIESNDQLSSIIEDGEVVPHEKYINADYEVKDVKDSFVKKIIEKLKELVQKFIEWCKKLTASIKGFFLKDCKGLIEEINKDLKNIQDAKTITDIIKNSKHIGKIKKYGNDTYNIFRFDGEGFVKDNIDKKTMYYTSSLDMQLVDKIFNDLEKDKKLSDSTKKQSEEYIKLMKSVKFVTKVEDLHLMNYYVRFRDNISGVENLKRVLYACAAQDISTIKFIDFFSSDIIKKLNNLENNAKNTLNDLKHLKQDGISSKDISLASSVINTTLSAGKVLYNTQLKIVNTALNVYRFKA